MKIICEDNLKIVLNEKENLVYMSSLYIDEKLVFRIRSKKKTTADQFLLNIIDSRILFNRSNLIFQDWSVL